MARALEQNQEVKKVYYPFQHGEEGFGAIVTIQLSDSADVNEFFKELGWIKIVPTLAGVETSASHPLTTSHRALPHEVCKELGITKQVVRISIGIEHADDLIAQLNEAVNRSLG